MTSINTNVGALNARASAVRATAKMETAMERLSSGLRINSAADDAAGLAVAGKMESQLRGINMSVRNAQDGVGLIQTGESGLNEIRNMVLNTRFNDVALLDGSFTGVTIQAGNTTAETIQLSFIDVGQTGLSINGAAISTQASATTVIGTMDSALETIASEQATMGSLINRLNFSVSNLSKASVMTEQAIGRVMDADFASETTQLSKQQILNQAATSMLAQANQSKQSILALLQ